MASGASRSSARPRRRRPHDDAGRANAARARRGAAYQSQTHLLAALHAWIVGRNLRDIGVGDLSQFYQAHPEFGLKNWPGGGVRKRWMVPQLTVGRGDSNIPGTS